MENNKSTIQDFLKGSIVNVIYSRNKTPKRYRKNCGRAL